MIDILAPVSKDVERKQKLKMKLYEESQKYYANNLNVFSNGMSLLSVSAHEMNNKAHIAKYQGKKMESISNNIEIHNTFMKTKTQRMIEKLNHAKARLNGDNSMNSQDQPQR